jgi:hypothetical protein
MVVCAPIKKSLTLIGNDQEKALANSPRVATHLLSTDEVADLLMRSTIPLGIDYLAVSFECGPLRLDSNDLWGEVRKKGEHFRRYITNLPLGQGSVFLDIKAKHSGSYGYAQVNPSTVQFGRRTEKVATLDQTLDVFHSMMEEIERIVEVRTSRIDVRLSRLDIAVTVPNVADVQRILYVATRTPYSSRLKPTAHFGPKGIESVSCRTRKSEGFSIYNKSLQAKKNGNLVRFESQARTKFLKQVTPTVMDLTDDSCRKIFFHYLQQTIDALRNIDRTNIDNIIASDLDRPVFIEAVGISTLADKGINIQMNDYWWNRKYKPFKKRYPHESIGDFF